MAREALQIQYIYRARLITCEVGVFRQTVMFTPFLEEPLVHCQWAYLCEITVLVFLLCRLLKRLDFPSMTFTLYFMGYEKAEDIPSDETERTQWMFTRKATVELTQ